jgi:hypothetical protein
VFVSLHEDNSPVAAVGEPKRHFIRTASDRWDEGLPSMLSLA